MKTKLIIGLFIFIVCCSFIGDLKVKAFDPNPVINDKKEVLESKDSEVDLKEFRKEYSSNWAFIIVKVLMNLIGVVLLLALILLGTLIVFEMLRDGEFELIRKLTRGKFSYTPSFILWFFLLLPVVIGFNAVLLSGTLLDLLVLLLNKYGLMIIY